MLDRSNIVTLSAFFLASNPNARVALAGAKEACNSLQADILAEMMRYDHAGGDLAQIAARDGPADVLDCTLLLIDDNGSTYTLDIGGKLAKPAPASPPEPVAPAPQARIAGNSSVTRWAMAAVCAIAVVLGAAIILFNASAPAPAKAKPPCYADSFASTSKPPNI